MNNTQEDIQDLAEFIEPFNPYGPKRSQLIEPIKTDKAVDEFRDNDAPKPRTTVSNRSQIPFHVFFSRDIIMEEEEVLEEMVASKDIILIIPALF